jgi:hypothetical protein
MIAGIVLLWAGLVGFGLCIAKDVALTEMQKPKTHRQEIARPGNGLLGVARVPLRPLHWLAPHF